MRKLIVSLSAAAVIAAGSVAALQTAVSASTAMLMLPAGPGSPAGCRGRPAKPARYFAHYHHDLVPGDRRGPGRAVAR